VRDGQPSALASHVQAQGNLRSAASTGGIAGPWLNNTASSAGSVACAGTMHPAHGQRRESSYLRWREELHLADCDTAHPCVVHQIDTVAARNRGERESPTVFKNYRRAQSPGNLLTLDRYPMSAQNCRRQR